MKYIIITLLFFTVIPLAVSTETQKPKIIVEKPSSNVTNMRIEGSLASERNLRCISLSEANNSIIPPDLFKGMADCIEKENYDDAAYLFYLARIFGIFDAKRVADKTAGQGITVLQMETFADLDEENTSKFKELLAADFKKGSNKFATFCKAVTTIGHPVYYPKYMTLHGISAFKGIQGNGLKDNFQSDVIWEELLSKNCSVKPRSEVAQNPSKNNDALQGEQNEYQVRVSKEGEKYTIFYKTAGGNKEQIVLKSPFLIEIPIVSTDGKYLAYISNENGYREFWVQSLSTGMRENGGRVSGEVSVFKFSDHGKFVILKCAECDYKHENKFIGSDDTTKSNCDKGCTLLKNIIAAIGATMEGCGTTFSASMEKFNSAFENWEVLKLKIPGLKDMLAEKTNELKKARIQVAGDLRRTPKFEQEIQCSSLLTKLQNQDDILPKEVLEPYI